MSLGSLSVVMLLNSDEMIPASQQEGTSRKLRPDLDKNLWRWFWFGSKFVWEEQDWTLKKVSETYLDASAQSDARGGNFLAWLNRYTSKSETAASARSVHLLRESFVIWGLSHFVTGLLPVGRRDVRSDELISELVGLLIDQSFRNLFSLFICTKLIWVNTQQLSSGFKAAWVLPVESLHVWLLWFPPAAQS